MTNDEIKEALIRKYKVRHVDRVRGMSILYAYAQAWRCSVGIRGEFVSSLELVSLTGEAPSVTIARADECEILKT